MYHVIVNPASKTGKGKAIWESIEPIFAEKNQEYKVFYSKAPSHATELVRQICEQELNSDDSVINLIVLGGDGTLDECIQGVTDFKRVQIGYVPTGSSNDFARDMGYPKNPAECLRNILDCKTPLYKDLGYLEFNSSEGCPDSDIQSQLHKRFFNVSCGIGYDAAICEEVQISPAKKILNKIGLGKLVYLVIALKQLFGVKRYNAVMTLDDEQKIELKSFLFMAAMIHRFEGGGFMFCPDASYQDGMLDICVASGISNRTVLTALPKAMKGKHFSYDGIDSYRAKKILIETEEPLWVHTDGEVSRKSNSITITCQKEVLALLK